MLSSRFSQALVYAADAHKEQTRKGTSVPYVAHVLAVAALALENGANEDEAIAALLHDTVEDCGGLPRLRDVRERFGEAVADIVMGCSDSTETPKPPWRERKETYLHDLDEASPSVLLVSACDKLHNVRSLLDLRSQRRRGGLGTLQRGQGWHVVVLSCGPGHVEALRRLPAADARAGNLARGTAPGRRLESAPLRRPLSRCLRTALSLPPLPIDDVLPQIAAALGSSPNVVIVAPPGAGKTTRVPPALLDPVAQRSTDESSSCSRGGWRPAQRPAASPPNSERPSATRSATRSGSTSKSGHARESPWSRRAFCCGCCTTIRCSNRSERSSSTSSTSGI